MAPNSDGMDPETELYSNWKLDVSSLSSPSSEGRVPATPLKLMLSVTMVPLTQVTPYLNPERGAMEMSKAERSENSSTCVEAVTHSPCSRAGVAAHPVRVVRPGIPCRGRVETRERRVCCPWDCQLASRCGLLRKRLWNAMKDGNSEQTEGKGRR